MKKNFERAFAALQKIGCPVIEGDDYGNDNGFRISGEDNGDVIWADYYDGEFLGYEFGVNPKVNAILRKNGLFAEWINAGVLGVYEA